MDINLRRKIVFMHEYYVGNLSINILEMSLFSQIIIWGEGVTAPPYPQMPHLR